MGITFLTFNGLVAPFQQLVGWLATAPAPRQRFAHPVPVAVPGTSRPGRPASSPAKRAAASHAHRPVRALRVLRVVDGCHAPASAGRMVISGRMADVCAELDRLAALDVERDQALTAAPTR